MRVTRLEMVIVKRSLDAANAIKAGNSKSRAASVSMTILLNGAELSQTPFRFGYRRGAKAIHLRRGPAAPEVNRWSLRCKTLLRLPRSGQGVRNRREGRCQLGAEAGHHRDDGNRNAGGNQAVLD